MIILGIETSCDETAASVVLGKGDSVKVLSNVVSSQIEIHKKYHGVVPEIAAREHILNILPVINEAMVKAGIKREEASKKLDAIAVTSGPGLITSLLAGVETAKTLAYSWNLPLIAVNHIEGHIRANYINSKSNVKLPAIILTVSGGHTMLVLMDKKDKFKIIGETRDDAAGEAFDKAAKLLNLGYPGGPIVSQTAAVYKGLVANTTHPVAEYCATPLTRGDLPMDGKIVLPRPMLNDPNFDFSFSGLKTSLLYKIQKDKNWQNRVPEYCYEFERAVVETLVGKAIKAARKYGAKTLMLAGGVSANSVLREEFMAAAKKEKINCQIPELQYTTDNAAMIAAAGYFHAKRKDFTPWKKIKANCNLGF
ncbi:MAG: tRNA (adenosine(37)-N6)-threonylcarbamoyltransferase complex transferase subunit TsaD [Patescibacteria group bacterium]|jgi:N6-L-threonylcarbamoyladenine synthase